MFQQYNLTNNIKKQELNAEQLAAVKRIQGPMMIIAGPGSGKTKVITERIIHLIKAGIKGRNILALTFTNKAAKEMSNRINEMLKKNETALIWMGTFHSIFARILREEIHNINYAINFTIYDNDDSIKMIRRILKDLHLDKETYNAKYIFNRISIMKNCLIDANKYKKNLDLIEEDINRKQPLFKKIYKKYCTNCQEANALDFDDLLLKMHELFEKNTDILSKYQDIFKYILIDEYQDTNIVQDQIIKQIAKKHQNVCVVGDDSQSIYSFRGANINNMLNFKNCYTNVKEFKLEQNYRSTKNIVNAANSLIAHNKYKIQKNIFTKNEEGEKIKLLEHNNGREEGEQITSIIYNSINQGNRKSTHAILYRTNSQSKAFEDGLRKRGINYKIFGGLSFYQRKEIKDVMAFLKLIINNHDNESLLRIINYPTRGIGTTTIEKIRIKAQQNQKTIWETISSNLLDEVKLTSRNRKNVLFFVNILHKLFKYKDNNIFNIIENVIAETGIIQRLKDELTEENTARIDNISELFNSIKLFSMKTSNNKLTHFINEVSLDESHESKQKNEDYVSLMTIHQSKGLEFPYVYIVGLENGLFPSQKSMRQKKSMEEERRLLYVAITRGIKRVTFSYVLHRFRFGIIDRTEKSLFIDEINHFFIEKNRNHSFKSMQSTPPKITNKKLVRITKNTSNEYRNDLKIGANISHNIFGKGKIIKIDNSDGNQKITVSFMENGEKILLTKFAKIKIIK